MAMEIEIVMSVRSALSEGRVADLRVIAPDGSSRLLFIPSTLIGPGEPPSLLIVLEGYGSIFYHIGESLNVFRLLMHGFPIHLSQTILELLNAVFPPICRHRRLSVPEGTSTENKNT
jgi:hypothetical protein